MGIASVTKKGYLLYKGLCLAITAAFFAFFLGWQPGPPLDRNLVLANLEWVVLPLTLVQVYETSAGLRRFRTAPPSGDRRTSL